MIKPIENLFQAQKTCGAPGPLNANTYSPVVRYAQAPMCAKH